MIGNPKLQAGHWQSMWEYRRVLLCWLGRAAESLGAPLDVSIALRGVEDVNRTFFTSDAAFLTASVGTRNRADRL